VTFRRVDKGNVYNI